MNHTYTRSAPWGHAVTIGLDAGEPDARQTAPTPRSSRKMRPSHASGTADGRPTRPERAAGRSARATPRQSADGGRRSRGRPPDGSRTTESNTRALSHRPPSGRSCASRRVRTRGRPHPDLNLAESAPNPRNRVTPSSGTPTFRPISQPRMGASRSRRGRRFSARACRPGRGCRPRASSMHRGSVPQALLRADRVRHRRWSTERYTADTRRSGRKPSLFCIPTGAGLPHCPYCRSSGCRRERNRRRHASPASAHETPCAPHDPPSVLSRRCGPTGRRDTRGPVFAPSLGRTAQRYRLNGTECADRAARSAGLRVITARWRSAPVSRSPCRRPLRCCPLAVAR